MSIFEKIYNRINWQNKPSTETPINADNLNKMDKAIDDLDDRVVSLSKSVNTNTTDISTLQTDVSANSEDIEENKTTLEIIRNMVCKSPIRVVQYFNSGIETGIVISGATDSGAVFEIPFNAYSISFTLENDIYCQFGITNDEGILPDLITTGANRGDFSVADTKGKYSIITNGQKGRFFIGGDNGMKVSNIMVETWL